MTVPRPPRQALVLIDVVPPSPLDPDLFQRLGTVLAVARRAGIRVVHVWSAAPGEPPPLTDPSVAPVAGEPVLPNPGAGSGAGAGAGAWASAGLEGTLAAVGVEQVTLAGRPDSEAWWATVEEAAARPMPLTVLSDRDPERDLRVRQLLTRSPGHSAALVDAGTWVEATAARGPDRPGGRRRVRLVTTLLAVLLLLAVGAAVIDHDAKGYYEFSPGSAPTVTASADCRVRGSGNDLSLADGTPCARLVVPAGRAHQVSGRLFMVDVLVGPASPFDFALDKLHLLHRFRSGTQLVPASAVLGTTPAPQLGCQEAQQMTGASQYAAVAALSRLGQRVKENDLGALVLQVLPGSAAEHAGVRCNDTVVAVNGRAVRTGDDLSNAVRAARPGQRATITVHRSGPGGAVVTKVITATLTGTPAEPPSGGSQAQKPQPKVAFLGVSSQTQLTYTLPFDVSIQVGDIGGPSAGLAFTLGLLDVLSNGQLTGGRAVAATGTIAPDGTVGDVGGVAQKTIAVRRAGAAVFLVPTVEYATAKSEAGSSLRVLPVASLDQALADLERLGGSFALPPAASNTTTTTTTPP